MKTYKDLVVWQKGIQLVALVYALTKEFPSEERFGLTSQIRRSAISIPSNIAEGYGRNSDGDFLRFLRIAYGSSAELETQLIIAEQLEYATKAEIAKVVVVLIEVRKILNKLIKTIAT